MPVDLIQPAMIVAGIILFFVILGSFKILPGGRRLRRVALTLLILCMVAYVRLYHFAQIWYGWGASRGDAYSEYMLGSSYMLYSHGAPFNPHKGFALIEKAAEKEYVPAQLQLAARLVSSGPLNTERDIKNCQEGLRWARRAQSNGSTEAALVIPFIEDKISGKIDYLSGEPNEIVMRWYKHPWSW